MTGCRRWSGAASARGRDAASGVTAILQEELLGRLREAACRRRASAPETERMLAAALPVTAPERPPAMAELHDWLRRTSSIPAAIPGDPVLAPLRDLLTAALRHLVLTGSHPPGLLLAGLAATVEGDREELLLRIGDCVRLTAPAAPEPLRCRATALAAGRIRKLVMVPACDVARKGRDYLAAVRRSLPPDALLLTFRCDRSGGEADDPAPPVAFPGCGDSGALAAAVRRTARIFGVPAASRLPLSLDLRWHEQRQAAALLLLLSAAGRRAASAFR